MIEELAGTFIRRSLTYLSWARTRARARSLENVPAHRNCSREIIAHHLSSRKCCSSCPSPCPCAYPVFLSRFPCKPQFFVLFVHTFRSLFLLVYLIDETGVAQELFFSICGKSLPVGFFIDVKKNKSFEVIHFLHIGKRVQNPF